MKAEADTIAGLEAAKGYIRVVLKERMGVRHVPELALSPIVPAAFSRASTN